MIPKVGQHVKCILRTGAMAEGIVEEWLPSGVHLRSLDKESILMIPSPKRDISLIKVILKMPKIDLPVADEAVARTDVKTSSGVRYVEKEISDLEHKFEQAQQLATDDPDKAKNLAELRIMMAAQEKKIISEKVRGHCVGNTGVVKYHNPFTPNKSSKGNK